MPLAEDVARWARGLELDDLPELLVHRAKLHVLDQLGAQLVASDRAPVRATEAYVKELQIPGRAGVTGSSTFTSAEFAAFVNATAGHCLELDDYARRAFAHPGCVVVPTAIAVGQETKSSGARVLTGIIAGFEHIIRLGLASMPSMLQDRGFHQTGAHGVFGAALAASILLDSPADISANALGIAGSQASGTTEYSQSGGEVKRLHAGFGATGGIRAAKLARLGVTAPLTIFEGRRGFLQAFSATHDASRITDGLGSEWRFLECAALKPWACVASIHANLAALDEITSVDQLDPREIDTIIMGTDSFTFSHAGSIGPRPTEMIEAQFSAEYSMAIRAVHGRNDVSDYLSAEAAEFADPMLRRVADRVELQVDPECDRQWPERWLGRTTVRLSGGATYSAITSAPGTPSDPLSTEQVRSKFHDCAAAVLSRAHAERVVDLVLSLDQLADLDELTQLLSADRTVPRQSGPLSEATQAQADVRET